MTGRRTCENIVGPLRRVKGREAAVPHRRRICRLVETRQRGHTNW